MLVLPYPGANFPAQVTVTGVASGNLRVLAYDSTHYHLEFGLEAQQSWGQGWIRTGGSRAPEGLRSCLSSSHRSFRLIELKSSPRCFLARGNCLSASGEDGPAVLRPGFLLTPLRVERLEFTFVVRKSHRCPAVKLSSSVPGGTIAGAEGPPPVLGLPGAGKVGSWCPGCVPRWMVRDPRKSRGTFIHLPESELRKHLHVL